MIPALSFLFFFAVLFGLGYALTAMRMGGTGNADGPARVGAALRSRNRAVVLFFVVVLLILAVLEALITDVSEAIEDLQYRVGDMVSTDPMWIYETGNGTVSWGLYLAILVGALAGVVLGTFVATRRYPVLRGLTLRDMI